MSLLPLLSQFIFPTVISLYISLATFFPIHPIQKHKEQLTILSLKKQENSTSVSVTPDEKHTNTTSHSFKNKQSSISQTEGVPILSQQPTQITLSPSVTDNNTSESSPTPTTSKLITAMASLSASGKTIHLSMTYPSSGGTISGKITGDCTGTLSGSFNQTDNQTVVGTGNASCPTGFISIPVTITFSGRLLSMSQASITYTISALGQTQKGNTTLNLSE